MLRLVKPVVNSSCTGGLKEEHSENIPGLRNGKIILMSCFHEAL